MMRVQARRSRAQLLSARVALEDWVESVFEDVLKKIYKRVNEEYGSNEEPPL